MSHCWRCNKDHPDVDLHYRPAGKAYTPGHGRDLEKEPCTVPNIKWIYRSLTRWDAAWELFKALTSGWWVDPDKRVQFDVADT